MSPAIQTAAFASGFQFPIQPALQTFPAYQQFAVMQSIPRDRRLFQPFADFRKRQWTSGLRASQQQLHEQQQAESHHSDETYTYLDESSIHKSDHDDSDSTTVQTAPESSDEELALIGTSTIDKQKTGILNLGLPPESILLLNLVAIIWGSQHAVIKTCIQDLDPASFSLVRFFLGSLFATPAWIVSSSSSSSSAESETDVAKPNGAILNNTWRWGLELGLWMFLGYAFQAIGLESTTAQRSGFFLYLNVKFVPFFAYLLTGRSISIPTWVSAFTALLGTGLLAYDGTSIALNQGDLWSIAAAAASAMFILRLEKATASVPNASGLNASCLWVVTAASLLWSLSGGLLTKENMIHTVTSHPLELLYLSAVTTALANWIQTKAQRNVTAERASVIYAMDPVWGAIWANIILGETLTGFGFVGAGLITVAAATNAFLDFGGSSSTNKK